jgi:hypothetical protein
LLEAWVAAGASRFCILRLQYRNAVCCEYGKLVRVDLEQVVVKDLADHVAGKRLLHLRSRGELTRIFTIMSESIGMIRVISISVFGGVGNAVAILQIMMRIWTEGIG